MFSKKSQFSQIRTQEWIPSGQIWRSWGAPNAVVVYEQFALVGGKVKCLVRTYEGQGSGSGQSAFRVRACFMPKPEDRSSYLHTYFSDGSRNWNFLLGIGRSSLFLKSTF